jgi:hypothetical protein
MARCRLPLSLFARACGQYFIGAVGNLEGDCFLLAVCDVLPSIIHAANKSDPNDACRSQSRGCARRAGARCGPTGRPGSSAKSRAIVRRLLTTSFLERFGKTPSMTRHSF